MIGVQRDNKILNGGLQCLEFSDRKKVFGWKKFYFAPLLKETFYEHFR